MVKLEDVLTQKAGVRPFSEDPVVHRNILETISYIMTEKTQRYGPHRLVVDPSLPPGTSRKLCYADLERKFQRYKHMVWGGEKDLELIIETLSDLIGHAVIAIQEVDRERTCNRS